MFYMTYMIDYSKKNARSAEWEYLHGCLYILESMISSVVDYVYFDLTDSDYMLFWVPE